MRDRTPQRPLTIKNYNMCKCICKNCGRYFLYGDCQSPMLSNKRWKEVVQFYNLSKYEKEAIERYDEHLLRAGWRAKEIENEHLYLCFSGSNCTLALGILNVIVGSSFIGEFIDSRIASSLDCLGFLLAKNATSFIFA